MDRESIHRDILRRILSLKKDCVRRVWLVSRLSNAELLGGDSVARTYLFLPDLHLVTRAADDLYRYTFRRLRPGMFLRREVILDGLCRVMLDFWNSLPTGRSLRTVQLGDFVDLWRENELLHDDITGLVSRILDDNTEARQRLVRRGNDSLEPDIVLGNHDLKMADSTELKRARRSFAYGAGGQSSLLATHGDLFDVLETLVDDEIQEWFLEHFGPSVEPNTAALDRTPERKDGMIGGSEGAAPLVLQHENDSAGLPDWVNVWTTVSPCDVTTLTESHPLLPKAMEYAEGLRAGKQRYLRRMDLGAALPSLRTIVIGHSHAARICIHRDRKDPGRNLVLADCGAWIEYAGLGSAIVPSCQIGVLCGGDLRIYQLDPHESLFETAEIPRSPRRRIPDRPGRRSRAPGKSATPRRRDSSPKSKA